MALDLVRSNAQSYMDLLVKSKKREEAEDPKNGKFADMMTGFMNGAKDEASAAAKAASAAVSSATGTQTDSSQSTSVPVLPGGVGSPDAAKLVDYTENIQRLLNDPDFAGKTIDELAAGLREDLESYGDRFMEPYIDAGVASAQGQMIGVIYAVDEPMKIPRPSLGKLDLGNREWADFHAEIARRQQPEYRERIKMKEEALRKNLRGRNEAGVTDQLRDEWELLTARASLTKAARNIDGFAGEYAADPAAAVKKYAEALNRYMQDVKVTMRNGVVTCSY